MHKTSVIIVGAGLSGLAAAHELSKDKRFEITILEERPYIGGRAHSVHVNNTAVDVGGFIIYPWYKNFRKILNELNITKKLSPLPRLDILYDLTSNVTPVLEGNIPISTATKGRMAIKLLPAFLNNLDVAHPNIERFKDVNVRDFLQKQVPALNDAQLETYIDIICQGYCYAPIEEYRAAFMLPMMGNNLFSGDVNTADYFVKGMDEMLNALERTLTKRGVNIQKNVSVKNIKKHQVITKDEKIDADTIIVSHPININIPFTRFVTVTVACDTNPTLAHHDSWGALFLHPNTCPSPNILSVINTQELYGKKLKHTLTLNIKLSKNEPMPTPNAAYAKQITDQLKKLFPHLKKATITSCTEWNHTMPISDTKTIQKLREEQGQDDIYYAGDYLGCPSMETAVSTGIDAAELIKKKMG